MAVPSTGIGVWVPQNERGYATCFGKCVAADYGLWARGNDGGVAKSPTYGVRLIFQDLDILDVCHHP